MQYETFSVEVYETIMKQKIYETIVESALDKPLPLNQHRSNAFGILQLVMMVLSVAWLIVIVVAIFGAAPLLSTQIVWASSEDISATVLFTLIVFIGGLLVLIVMIQTINIIRSIREGLSPFSFSMVRKIRLLSTLLIAYGLVDSFFRSYFSLLVVNGLHNLLNSFNGSAAFVTQPYSFPEFNVGSLVAGLVVLVISFVFEYGIELQEESDSFL